jgi:uncharacterized membrane protein
VDKKEYHREYFKKHYPANRSKYIETAKQYRYNLKEHNPSKYLYQVVKQNASKRGIEFNIEVEDIVVPSHCPILGIELKFHTGKYGPEPNTPSIDRKDPSKGYVKGNVHVLSHKANTLKNNATIEDIEKLLNYMKTDYEANTRTN